MVSPTTKNRKQNSTGQTKIDPKNKKEMKYF
jgi:hypothetical protein